MSDPLEGFYAVLDGYIGRAVGPLRETIKEQAKTIERLEASAGAINPAPVLARVDILAKAVEIQTRLIEELKARPVVHGKDGAPGTTGARGADGTPGKDGISVMDAAIDADGLLLLTLSDGTAKRVGKVRGADGARGSDGKDGEDGTGDVGPPGERGEKGNPGPAGERGEKGESGPLGERGEKGEQGALGSRGEGGPIGEKGDAGEKGDVGAIGEKGLTGERGDKGEKGEAGLIGKTGDNGRDGNDGVGINGKDGASAVDIARSHGFTGSDLDWLTSLRGKDGTNAANGKDGRDAFDIAREHGFGGSAFDWIASLRGKDGTSGRDGISILSAVVDGEGELVLTASDGTLRRAGVVRGENGTNGTRGEHGEAGRDAVAIRPIAMIEEERSYPAGTFAHHAGGAWYAERSTDALKGSRPQDCGWYPITIGEQSCSVDLADDGRTIVVKRKTSTGLTFERRFKVPVVIDRGIYTASKPYERGDAVTRAGSYFVARVDQPSGMPGASDDWRMLIKGAKP